MREGEEKSRADNYGIHVLSGLKRLPGKQDHEQPDIILLATHDTDKERKRACLMKEEETPFMKQ